MACNSAKIIQEQVRKLGEYRCPLNGCLHNVSEHPGNSPSTWHSGWTRADPVASNCVLASGEANPYDQTQDRTRNLRRCVRLDELFSDAGNGRGKGILPVTLFSVVTQSDCIEREPFVGAGSIRLATDRVTYESASEGDSIRERGACGRQG